MFRTSLACLLLAVVCGCGESATPRGGSTVTRVAPASPADTGPAPSTAPPKAIATH